MDEQSLNRVMDQREEQHLAAFLEYMTGVRRAEQARREEQERREQGEQEQRRRAVFEAWLEVLACAAEQLPPALAPYLAAHDPDSPDSEPRSNPSSWYSAEVQLLAPGLAPVILLLDQGRIGSDPRWKLAGKFWVAEVIDWYRADGGAILSPEYRFSTGVSAFSIEQALALADERAALMAQKEAEYQAAQAELERGRAIEFHFTLSGITDDQAEGLYRDLLGVLDGFEVIESGFVHLDQVEEAGDGEKESL